MLKSLKWRFNISSFLYLEVFQTFIIMLFLSQLCPISFSISFNLMLSEKYTGKKQDKIHWHIFFFFLYLFIYFTLNIVLVLPYIDLNPPWVYMCSPSWTHLPPPIPLGHPSAPAPSTLSHASNLDWRLVSHMIIYMFQCHSSISSCPRPLPQSPKDCSIHLCLFCCLAYRVIISYCSNWEWCLTAFPLSLGWPLVTEDSAEMMSWTSEARS